ncbi:unnamed protein product [Meganyctiphanes norvegica]|uniref:Uncharacterized protein n=1 Tax=Meganyctiphanes norvegica TaxID=48144 RepID=A0AAV2QZL6_MEGNR
MNYGRTGARSWSIGTEKVQLKPLRRGRPAVTQAPKPPEPEQVRRGSMPGIPPKDPLNHEANYNIKLVPNSPPIIEAGLPPKPVSKVKKPENTKKRIQSVDVSFTFVIGGDNWAYSIFE